MSVKSPKWEWQRGGIFNRKPYCEHSEKDAKYLARSAKIAERIAGDISSKKDKWISYSLGLANTLAS
jgi:hypothetical protein